MFQVHDDISSPINTTAKPFPPIPLTKFAGICICIFGIIGIMANGLVLTVIGMSGKKSFSTYKYFISHLALADFLASVMSMVYFPLELHKHNWIYARYSCKFIYPSITFFETISCGTIIMISIERYKYVILPHSSPWRRHHVILSLAIVWFTCLVLVTPNIIAIKVTHYPNISYCNENWPTIKWGRTWQLIYGISFFAFAYLVPCISIIVMHSHILLKLRKRPQPSNDSDHRSRNDRRIKRVLTGIIIAFFLCISPNKLLYLVWDIAPHLEKDLHSRARLFLRIPYLFYYMRVAVDPLIYCFLDTRFKKDLGNNKIIMFLAALLGKSTGKPNRNRARTVSTQPSITMSATLSVDPSSLVLSHIHMNGVANGNKHVSYSNGSCQTNGVGSYRSVINGHTNGALVMDESPTFRESTSFADESPTESVGALYMEEFTASRTSHGTVNEESTILTSTKGDDESSYTASERDEDGVAKPRTASTITENTCVYGSGSYTPSDGVLSEQTEF